MSQFTLPVEVVSSRQSRIITAKKDGRQFAIFSLALKKADGSPIDEPKVESFQNPPIGYQGTAEIELKEDPKYGRELNVRFPDLPAQGALAGGGASAAPDPRIDRLVGQVAALEAKVAALSGVQPAPAQAPPFGAPAPAAAPAQPDFGGDFGAPAPNPVEDVPFRNPVEPNLRETRHNPFA